jgi:hypothetical protein
MKTKWIHLALLIGVWLTACSSDNPLTSDGATSQTAATDSSASVRPDTTRTDTTGTRPDSLVVGGGTPPAAAYAACVGKDKAAACEFTLPSGPETGVCETVEGALACSPQHSQTAAGPTGGTVAPAEAAAQAYNVDQAVSDKAQGMTIAFDALAFLTGDLGADSFFPPGKVADFWGFQYLRDNDPSQMGHAGAFLTSAAMNVLNTLTAAQRARLVTLAQSQVQSIDTYGYRRFVLMDAFRRLLEGDLPAGTTGLSRSAVTDYSAQLYVLDGQISYERAELMGSLLSSLDATQRATLDAMVGKGMLEWPTAAEPADVAHLDRTAKVAVMTYAADMFSWYAGSVEADVYFCPERHGTYFGSFYLKDIRAMSDPTYAIPTDMTGNLGDAMLASLEPAQAQLITGLVDLQRPSLLNIVATRRQVATELRQFLSGGTADPTTVNDLMQQYGSLDGEIIYQLATHFAAVRSSLSDSQKTQLAAMRLELLGELTHPSGAYLYSQAIPMPAIASSDGLFE